MFNFFMEMPAHKTKKKFPHGTLKDRMQKKNNTSKEDEYESMKVDI